MEVKEQNENKLVIENSLATQLTSPEAILGFIGGSVLLLFMLISLEYRPMLPFLVVAGIIGVLFWVVAAEGVIYNCVFEKETETILADIRTPWPIWVSHITKIPFRDVDSLTLKKTGKENPKLLLHLEATSIRFAGKGESYTAERISDFLGVPLYIEIDNERVTRFHQTAADDTGKVTPTFCIKCGAPLPPITAGMMNVKCAHCGMTMVISWSEGKISYKAKPS
jgi:hypothetical protein